MKIGTLNNVKDRICKWCNAEFKNCAGSEFANHVRWCKKNPYLDIQAIKMNGRRSAEISNSNTHGVKQYYFVQCNYCFDYFVIERREKTFLKKRKFFCSPTCRNTRIHSEETKNKIRNSICKNGRTLTENSIFWWKDSVYVKKVLDHSPCFSSKGERELRDWFISSFPNEEWTYGGPLKYENISGIIRDLYSKKLKINIEYDGIWHFEDIVGQLESKQMKDQALESWCIENNWRLIRIKDEIYRSDKIGWKNKIRNEVINGTEQIVKFY